MERMRDGRRKLTEKQVEEIKEKRKSGMSYGKIAKEYGVSKHVIIYHTNEKTKARIRKFASENWKKYYSTEKGREAKRRYIAKKKLLCNGQTEGTRIEGKEIHLASAR